MKLSMLCLLLLTPFALTLASDAVPLTPADAGTISTIYPLFECSSVPSADQYEFDVQADDNGWQTLISRVSVFDSFDHLFVDPTYTNYRWRVRTITNNVPGAWSDFNYFGAELNHPTPTEAEAGLRFGLTQDFYAPYSSVSRGGTARWWKWKNATALVVIHPLRWCSRAGSPTPIHRQPLISMSLQVVRANTAGPLG